MMKRKLSPQRRKDTKVEIAKQTFTLLRHCEERHWSEFSFDEVKVSFAGSKQRSNLPSLTGSRELFSSAIKTTSLQSQSREIASWIQQRLSIFILNALSTETRNDELECKRRKLRRLHENENVGTTGTGLWAV
jgi:hypothetical protein